MRGGCTAGTGQWLGGSHGLQDDRNTQRSPNQKNVRNPNYYYFSKKVLQYTSNLYYNTPPICIVYSAVGAVEYSGKGTTSILFSFVSQYASHLYRNTPPICIAMLLGKSWWLWSPECSPPNPPEFAQPRLSRLNDGRPQRQGTNLCVFVPVWLVLPRCVATNLGVFDLCHFALLNRLCTFGCGFGAR